MNTRDVLIARYERRWKLEQERQKRWRQEGHSPSIPASNVIKVDFVNKCRQGK